MKCLCCSICLHGLKYLKNSLYCRNGHGKFTIRNGIPILINYNDLSQHSSQQIQFFESEQEFPTLDGLLNLSYWKKRYVERFLENFGNIKDKLVIDCGTGVGYMAVELARKGAKVIACDITFKNLMQLKKIAKKLNLENNMFFACCSAEELPFKSTTFDYYVSNAVLEHIPREDKAFSEINRVTKERAGVMITVPLSYRYIYPIFIPINYIHDKKLGHLRRYNEKILCDKLASFKLIKKYYTGHFNKVIKTIVNTFINIFNEKEIEEEDKRKENIKYGASNIICIFIKNDK